MLRIWLYFIVLCASYSYNLINPFYISKPSNFIVERNSKVQKNGPLIRLNENKASYIEEHPRVSILAQISDEPGALHEVLRYFWKYDLDITHIESRPCQKNVKGFNIYIDFEGRIGEIRTDKLMKELQIRCQNMLVLDEREVPWFPRSLSDLDYLAIKTLDAGKDLECDHPGFHDPDYRRRREYLASIAKNYRHDQDIPIIEYTEHEIRTWGAVYNKLRTIQQNHACKEYLKILEIMKNKCNYGPDCIPQARDISQYLQMTTGFRLYPVAGLLSSRDFLNGLAFKAFFSTQYLRHSSRPFYTPEPDICHELLGHAPMFADPDFAAFSQEIGLASLGANDADIKRLASCYWHSVEFGLVRGNEPNGNVKAYGAGLLSSFGELEYACGNYKPNQDATNNSPQYIKWDPEIASEIDYPITCYQPNYFVAESIENAKEAMRKFCENLPRPFYARYNSLTNTIWVDRAVRSKKSE